MDRLHNEMLNGVTPLGRRLRQPPSAEEIGKAVFGGHRLEILEHLAHSASSVGAIAARLDLGMVTISQNLRVLTDLGLVSRRKRGKTRIYGITAALEIRKADGRLIMSYEDANRNFVVIGTGSDTLAAR